MNLRLLPRILLLALLSPLVPVQLTESTAADLGSSLSYQAHLNFSGAPANGTFDFRFSLWDAGTGGTQIGDPVSISALPVANGQLSAALDFGLDAFAGGARWIEIAVRSSASTNAPTILTPRQQVGALPYALYSLASPPPLNYPADHLTGKAPDALLGDNIPRLMNGKLPDSLLSGNIAQLSNLTTLSNNLALVMAGVKETLISQINSLSNAMRSNVPAGVTIASIQSADTNLISQGMMNTISIPAPPWVNGTSVGQPSARSENSTVWTGTEMIIWGGKLAPAYPTATGGRYRPDVDQWTTVSTISGPTPRSGHIAIWSGQEMIVWGGFGTAFLGTGGKYQPALQRWIPTANAGAPSERFGHVGVWNGSRLIVWGGRNAAGALNDGGLYDPVSDAWTSIALPNPPTPRHGGAAVWAGDRLLVWGGEGDLTALNTGSQLRFDGAGHPLSWQSMSTQNAPSPRSGHSAVWTGSRLIIWGGANSNNLLGDGASYDPNADTWTPLPASNAPSARASHVAAWTGAEMIIWSGAADGGSQSSGGAYDPAANIWRSLANPGSPLPRDHASAMWSGSELLVFGGLSNRSPLSNLQRVNPQPAWYLYRKL